MLVRKFFEREKVDGRFGVEIEVEGSRLPGISTSWDSPARNYWRVERDGSLRGDESAEYVLRNPCDIDMVEKALNALSQAYKDNRSTISDTVRAGIHIHVNVQDMTILHLMNYITSYYVLENLLLKYCGNGRESNHFCFRAKDAEYVIFALERALKHKAFGYLSNNSLRYSSMNLNALFSYGSLEFRAMRSTSDMEKISNWCKVLDRIRVASAAYESPSEIISQMSEDGGVDFASTMLGDYYKLFSKEDVEKLVLEGVRNAQVIAYAIDWDTFNAKELSAYDNADMSRGGSKRASKKRQQMVLAQSSW